MRGVTPSWPGLRPHGQQPYDLRAEDWRYTRSSSATRLERSRRGAECTEFAGDVQRVPGGHAADRDYTQITRPPAGRAATYNGLQRDEPARRLGRTGLLRGHRRVRGAAPSAAGQSGQAKSATGAHWCARCGAGAIVRAGAVGCTGDWGA